MQALTIVEKNSPVLNELEAKKDHATELYHLGKFEEARAEILEALSQAGDDDMRLVLACNWAAIERRLGNHLLALSLYNLVARLAEATESNLYKGHYYNGLGLVCRALGFHHRALTAYREAIKFYNLTTDWTSLKNTENNLAFLLIATGHAGEAVERLHKIKANLEALNQPARAAEVQDTLAQAYLQIGDTDQALEYAAKSYLALMELGEIQAAKTSKETLRKILNEETK